MSFETTYIIKARTVLLIGSISTFLRKKRIWIVGSLYLAPMRFRNLGGVGIKIRRTSVQEASVYVVSYVWAITNYIFVYNHSQ